MQMLVKRIQRSVLVLIGVACLGASLPVAVAQDDDAEAKARDQRQTRRVETLSKKVHEKLTKAQEALDVEPESDVATATRIINELLGGELTGFERGNVLNFKGYLEYLRGDSQGAIRAYEQMIEIDSLEPGTIQSTIYTLAQLYAQEENFSKTVEYLNRWFTSATNPAPEPYVLLAQAHAQLEQFRQMIAPLDAAVAEARERGQAPKEEWYNLKYYACYQLENYNCVANTLKTLIATWPSKTYWLQLGGIYAELEQERNMLAVYEAAYTDGLLTSETELVTMAQLYLQGDLPFKAASVLEQAMEGGSVGKTAKNYRLLSQAWTLAQDDKKSIPALREASRLSDDGNLGAGLAIAYLNTGQYSECVGAGRGALQKGGLKRPTDVSVTIGMCLYNLDRLADARSEFQRIARNNEGRQKNLATQWIKVIDSDQARLDELSKARRQLREQRRNNSREAADEQSAAVNAQASAR